MQQWEYLVIDTINGSVYFDVDEDERACLPLQEYLDFFGKKGWEVVTACCTSDADNPTYLTIILKRPL